MRESLQRYKNQRATFTGVVVRKGTKYSSGGMLPTLLLKTITDSTGRITADYIWLNVRRDPDTSWLEPGDTVRFDAQVVQYQKVDRGSLGGIGDKSSSIDYTLKCQTKLVKITPDERTA